MLKILVIRRDNIGDMVCTTPLLQTLRKHYPKAYIAVLGNSYNCPVLDHFTEIDALFSYTKSKHRRKNCAAIYWDRLRLLIRLKKLRFDWIFLAGSGYVANAYKWSKLLQPAKIVGYAAKKGKNYHSVPYPPNQSCMHEVEKTHYLLSALNIHDSPPALKLCVTAQEKAAAQDLLPRDSKKRIAVHISCRKPDQAWPIERYLQAMQCLQEDKKGDVHFIILWSPGTANNPFHPGDDEKARWLKKQSQNICATFLPTHSLRELMAALLCCDLFFGSDGGAMHIACAFGLPCVCFFGNSSPIFWRPWKVPCTILQPPSLKVRDISVAQATNALVNLMDITPCLY